MNKFQPIFDKQKDYFNTNATKSYEWRIEQLDRMARMLNENNEAFQEAVSQDFKTALEEKVFEVAAPLATIEFTKMQLKGWMEPTSAMVPKALVASGHTAQVIREPYGVTLIIGAFNGPLILLLDPAITALSAARTVRPVVRAFSISSRAFRRPSNMSRERLSLKGSSSLCTDDSRTSASLLTGLRQASFASRLAFWSNIGM